MIKNKIKQNYNNLYENYDANKTEILRSIQHAENCRENPMKNKLENVIKQKSQYDKLKAQVELNQKKLKKLLTVRQQLKGNNSNCEQLIGILNDRVAVISHLQKHERTLEYEAAILRNMEKQRTKIKLNLKQRHENMRKNEETKKKRIEKITDSNHTKQTILKGIEDKIYREDQCELPENLLEELQTKLESYEGKHAQQNILKHENKLSEVQLENERSLREQQKQIMRTMRSKKEEDTKKQFDIAYNHLKLKQMEEEKIKKLCKVDDITEIAGDALQKQNQNLQYIRAQLEAEINAVRQDSKSVQEDIQRLITNLENIPTKTNMLELEKQLEQEEKQLRRISTHMQKKQANINQWQHCLHMIGHLHSKNSTQLDCDKFQILEKIKEMIPAMELLSTRCNLSTNQQTLAKPSSHKLKKVGVDSEQSYKSDDLSLE